MSLFMECRVFVSVLILQIHITVVLSIHSEITPWKSTLLVKYINNNTNINNNLVEPMPLIPLTLSRRKYILYLYNITPGTPSRRHKVFLHNFKKLGFS